MHIDEAITRFDEGARRTFSSEDVAKIKSVVRSLNLSGFDIKYKESDDSRLYIFDKADIVHVHGTMIVSQRQFAGSRDRGAKPYPKWPYFLPLDRWVER